MDGDFTSHVDPRRQHERCISMIAGVGRQGQIGFDGRLPWTDSDDLKWFKFMTRGADLIVGPKTAETLPTLHGRRVFIDDAKIEPNAYLSMTGLWDGRLPKNDIFVIGGAATFSRWLPYVRRVYLGLIAYDGPADTFMPPLWGERSEIVDPDPGGFDRSEA